MVKIIADPGSCHMGNINFAKELILAARDSGADAIKFQLFEDKPPNIELPREWAWQLRERADELGIDLFFSVFDYGAMSVAVKCGCTSAKIAFSLRNDGGMINACRALFGTVYVSGDTNTDFIKDTTKLYCIPEYPVKYLIDFEGIFPRFDGFSSHCLGIKQDLFAISAGAKIIEKHIRLDNSACDSVPDGKFAIRPKEFYSLCKFGKEIK